MGVACDVVVPSLIPRRAGDRVKTGKRDAIRLTRLHRAGELTATRVPSPAEDAVRDLVRARAARVYDSGSDRDHYAAPAGHPRPPPAPEPPRHKPHAQLPHCRLSPASVQGACGVATASAARPWTQATARTIRQLSGHRAQTGMPRYPARTPPLTPKINKDRADDLQRLDRPLHMS